MSTYRYQQTLVDRAHEHRPPPDRDTARAAAIELRSRGLTVHDISAALRISEGAVRALLCNPQEIESL